MPFNLFRLPEKPLDSLGPHQIEIRKCLCGYSFAPKSSPISIVWMNELGLTVVSLQQSNWRGFVNYLLVYSTQKAVWRRVSAWMTSCKARGRRRDVSWWGQRSEKRRNKAELLMSNSAASRHFLLVVHRETWWGYVVCQNVTWRYSWLDTTRHSVPNLSRVKWPSHLSSTHR